MYLDTIFNNFDKLISYLSIHQCNNMNRGMIIQIFVWMVFLQNCVNQINKPLQIKVVANKQCVAE